MLVASLEVSEIDDADERSVAVEGRGGNEGLALLLLETGKSRSVADGDLVESLDVEEERLEEGAGCALLGGGGGCFFAGGGGGGFLRSFLDIFSTSVTACWDVPSAG